MHTQNFLVSLNYIFPKVILLGGVSFKNNNVRGKVSFLSPQSQQLLFGSIVLLYVQNRLDIELHVTFQEHMNEMNTMNTNTLAFWNLAGRQNEQGWNIRETNHADSSIPYHTTKEIYRGFSAGLVKQRCSTSNGL